MALVLKQGKTITDQFGNVYSDAYLVIDRIELDKKNKHALFYVDIYKDKTSRDTGAKPFISTMFEVDDFDQWFPITQQNQFAQAYEYIKQYKENVGTIDEPQMVLKYQDWEDLP